MLLPLLYDYECVVPTSDRFVVFDRDQTLIQDAGYTFRPKDLRWMPFATDLLAELEDAGVAVFIATNQSGVARGLFSIEQMASFHRLLVEDAAAHGGRIRAIAICPHHEQGLEPRLTGYCACRKPQPGLLRSLETRYQLRWSDGLVVGDKDSDRQAAERVGAQTVDAREYRWDRQVLRWLEGSR